jgi:hypothetical protein
MSNHNATTVRGNFVFVRADGLRLMLPQEQVGAAEYRRAGEEGGRIYAALSAGMTLLDDCPPERFVVTTLGDGSDGVAWCWNELQVLIGIELHPRPLPATLVGPSTPVGHYVEHAGELAFLCDAPRLQAFALASGNRA